MCSLAFAPPSSGRPAGVHLLWRWQLTLILNGRLESNAIVQLKIRDENDDDKWQLEVNGHRTSIGRAQFELLMRLAEAARRDPLAFVTTRQLSRHLEERLPCGGADAAEIHRIVYALRQLLGAALESSPRRGEGYRLSTPNIILQSDVEKTR